MNEAVTWNEAMLYLVRRMADTAPNPFDELPGYREHNDQFIEGLKRDYPPAADPPVAAETVDRSPE